MIDEYARASAAAGGFDRADAALIRLSMRLDPKGFAQLAKAYMRLVEQAQRIEQAAQARTKSSPHEDDIVDVGVVLMLFEAVRLGQALAAGKQRRRRRSGARAASA